MIIALVSSGLSTATSLFFSGEGDETRKKLRLQAGQEGVILSLRPG